MSREGSYPAPPRWPDRLTTPEVGLRTHPMDPLNESEAVIHSYVLDGWPGPCAMMFDGDNAFLRWMPGLTIERAENYARRS